MLVERNREIQLSGFRADGQRGCKNINGSDVIIPVILEASNFLQDNDEPRSLARLSFRVLGSRGSYFLLSDALEQLENECLT